MSNALKALIHIGNEWNGSIVYWEPEFPDLLFAKDGESYELDGRRCVTIEAPIV